MAKSFDAPIKLLFPRPGVASAGGAAPFSMLGLGDIVIPGVFVALLLRFDRTRGAKTPTYFVRREGGGVRAGGRGAGRAAARPCWACAQAGLLSTPASTQPSRTLLSIPPPTPLPPSSQIPPTIPTP